MWSVNEPSSLGVNPAVRSPMEWRSASLVANSSRGGSCRGAASRPFAEKERTQHTDCCAANIECGHSAPRSFKESNIVSTLARIVCRLTAEFGVSPPIAAQPAIRSCSRHGELRDPGAGFRALVGRGNPCQFRTSHSWARSSKADPCGSRMERLLRASLPERPRERRTRTKNGPPARSAVLNRPCAT